MGGNPLKSPNRGRAEGKDGAGACRYLCMTSIHLYETRNQLNKYWCVVKHYLSKKLRRTLPLEGIRKSTTPRRTQGRESKQFHSFHSTGCGQAATVSTTQHAFANHLCRAYGRQKNANFSRNRIKCNYSLFFTSTVRWLTNQRTREKRMRLTTR